MIDEPKADLRISVAQGNITVNADMGVVQVRAKNVMVQADQDIDLQAGRNVNKQDQILPGKYCR